MASASKEEPIGQHQEVIINPTKEKQPSAAAAKALQRKQERANKIAELKRQREALKENISKPRDCEPVSAMTVGMDAKTRKQLNICPAEDEKKSGQSVAQSPVPSRIKERNSGKSTAGQSQAPSYACTPGAKATATSNNPFASRIFSKQAICQPDNDPFVIVFHQNPPHQWDTGGNMSKEEWKNVYRHVGHTSPYHLVSPDPGWFTDIDKDLWAHADGRPMLEAAQELGRASGGGFYGIPRSSIEQEVARKLYRDPIGQNITHWMHDEEFREPSMADLEKWFVDEMHAGRPGKPAPAMISNYLQNWIGRMNDSWNGQTGLAAYRSMDVNWYGNTLYYSLTNPGGDGLKNVFNDLLYSLRMQPNALDLASEDERKQLVNEAGYYPRFPSVDNTQRFASVFFGDSDTNPPRGPILPDEYRSMITLATLDGGRFFFIFTSMSHGHLGGASAGNTPAINADAIYNMAKAANQFESTKNSIKNSDYTYNQPLLDKSSNIIFRSRENKTTHEQWFAAAALSGSPSVRVQLSANAGTLTNLFTGAKTSVSSGTATIQLSRISELYHFAPTGVTPPQGGGSSPQPTLLVTPTPISAPAPSAISGNNSSGFIGWWKLDETGANVTDASGNGATGTLMNGPAKVSGKAGSALHFDGIDDYISVSGISAPSSTITYAAWVNLEGIASTANDHRIIAALAIPGSESTHSFLAIGDGGPVGDTRMGFAFNEGGWDNGHGADGSTNVPLTGWHHVAAAYDGSTVRLYLNGQLDSVKQIGKALPSGGAYAFTIGTRGALVKRDILFEGSLDDVRLYGRALSDSEIAALYSAAGGEAAIPTPTQSSQPSPGPSVACSSTNKTSSVPFASRIFSKPAICQKDNDPFITIFHQHPTPDLTNRGTGLTVGGKMSKDEWMNVYKHVGYIAPYALIGSWYMFRDNSAHLLWDYVDTTPMHASHELNRFVGGGFYSLARNTQEIELTRKLYSSPVGQMITHWGGHDYEYDAQGDSVPDIGGMKTWLIDEMQASRSSGATQVRQITNYHMSNSDKVSWNGQSGLAAYRAAGFTSGSFQYYSFATPGEDALKHIFLDTYHTIRMHGLQLATPDEKAYLEKNRAYYSVDPSVDNIFRFGTLWLGNAWRDEVGMGALPADEYAALLTLATLDGNRHYYVFTAMSEGTLGPKGQSAASGATFNADSLYAMAKAASWFENTKNSFKDSEFTYHTPLLDKSSNIIFRSRENSATNEQWFAAAALNGSPSVRVQLSVNSGMLTNLSTGVAKSVSGGVATVQLTARAAELYHFAPTGVTPPSSGSSGNGGSAGSGSGGNQPTPTPSASPSPVPSATPSATPSTTPNPNPSAAPASSSSVNIRIDVGAKRAYTDKLGQVWSADYGSKSGTIFNRLNKKGPLAVANTDDDMLYQTERYGHSNYAIPVPNGAYTLKLHFAENVYSQVGKRVFNVYVEKQLFSNLTGVDVYKESGKRRNYAIVKTVNVAVSDGVLNIDFQAINKFTLINAIEISNGLQPTIISDYAPPTPVPTSTSVAGLLGQWEFDETGASAADASGRGAAGSLVNGPTRISGKTGNALRFDGVNDYVNVNGVTAPSSAISYAAWVNLEGIADTANDHRIIAALAIPGTEATHSFLAIGDWGPGNDTRIGFAFNRGGWDSGNGADGNTNVPLTGWHHVAAAYDGSTVRFYLDGQLDSLKQIGKALPSEEAYELTIGTRGALAKSDLLFEGSLDDVRVYSRALTESEITALYSAGGGQNQVTPSPTPQPSSAASPASSSFVDATGAMWTYGRSIDSRGKILLRNGVEQPITAATNMKIVEGILYQSNALELAKPLGEQTWWKLASVDSSGIATWVKTSAPDFVAAPTPAATQSSPTTPTVPIPSSSMGGRAIIPAFTKQVVLSPGDNIQSAIDAATPGTEILLREGTYMVNKVSITKQGNANAWIKLGRYGNEKPVLKHTGSWSMIQVLNGGAYILIEGLVMEGNRIGNTAPDGTRINSWNDMLNYAKSRNCGSTNGWHCNQGIYVGTASTSNQAHHVVLRDNVAYNFGGSGLSSYAADYLVIEDNISYKNGNFSRYGESGISIFGGVAVGGDNSSEYGHIIRRNRTYENAQFVTSIDCCGDTITDGNGIIVDNFTRSGGSSGGGAAGYKYPRKVLIESNISYKNGNSGMHSVHSEDVDFINNTTYKNGYEMAAWVGSHSNRFMNNIIFANGNTNALVSDQSSNVVSSCNTIYQGTVNVSGSGESRANPLFTDPENGNFTLQASSPAINSASCSPTAQYDFNGKLTNGAKDRGALEFSDANGVVSSGNSSSVASNSGAGSAAPIGQSNASCEAGIHAFAASRGKFFGTQIGQKDWVFSDDNGTVRSSYQQYAALAKKHVGWLTLNEFTHSRLASGSNTKTSSYVRWAHQNGMKVLAVQLLWPGRTESQRSEEEDLFAGVSTREQAIARLDAWIKSVMATYGDKSKPDLYVDMWGLFNEAFANSDEEAFSSTDRNLRGNDAKRLIGEDWPVVIAQIVQKYNPGVPMLFNDMHYELTWQAPMVKKQEYAIKVLQMMKNAGVSPLPYVGSQTHIYRIYGNEVFKDLFDRNQFKGWLDKIQAIGSKYIITELGILRTAWSGGPLPTDQQQAETLSAILPTAFSHPAFLGAYSWGLSDPYAWGIVQGSEPGNPQVDNGGLMEFLPFSDAAGTMKKHGKVICDAFAGIQN